MPDHRSASLVPLQSVASPQRAVASFDQKMVKNKRCEDECTSDLEMASGTITHQDLRARAALRTKSLF